MGSTQKMWEEIGIHPLVLQTNAILNKRKKNKTKEIFITKSIGSVTGIDIRKMLYLNKNVKYLKKMIRCIFPDGCKIQAAKAATLLGCSGCFNSIQSSLA